MMGCSVSTCFADSERHVHTKNEPLRVTKSRTSGQSLEGCNDNEIDLSHFTIQEKIIGLGGEYYESIQKYLHECTCMCESDHWSVNLF
jgi:hypothetical protein